MKYLGVDYGMKKVGLAVSEGQVASPLKVLSISGLKDGVEKVGHEIRREQVQRVVIGIPEGSTGKMVKNFVSELKKKYAQEQVQIIETEETLSSKDALNLMVTLGTSQKERKNEDAYSAMLILQQFLDTLS